MFLVLERLRRGLIHMTLIAVALGASGALTSRAFAQRPTTGQSQSGLSNVQRMDVMRSKLEAMRRSLESGVAALNAKDTNDKSKNPDDPGTRLRGLLKEVSSVQSEITDLRSKEDKAEKYDPLKLDALEQSVADLNTRVEAALQATASARRSGDQISSDYKPKPQKGKRRLFGILPGKSQDKYTELTGSVAPGRDRVLFLEATKEVRKG